MAIPPEHVLDSPARARVDKYYQSKSLEAEDRIALFKLAWDLVGSSFGGRQDLYERFFLGDPVRMASNYYNQYEKEPYRSLVKGLIGTRENG